MRHLASISPRMQSEHWFVGLALRHVGNDWIAANAIQQLIIQILAIYNKNITSSFHVGC